MKLLILCAKALLLFMMPFQDRWHLADGYDPLDPTGNITVTFDIVYWTEDGYFARVTLQNYYQYRHVEQPGWNLGWAWAGGEVILSTAGAVAKRQGDCSGFKSRVPYSCTPDPVFADLDPHAPPEKRSANCCHGGLLAAGAIDPLGSSSSFELLVGNLGGNASVHCPLNLTLLAPGGGYTCRPFLEASPTKLLLLGGTREEQVFRTWKSACTYSPFVANKSPVCCVSMSAFYNPKITPCPACSCSCPGDKRPVCQGDGEMKRLAAGGDLVIGCTDHMCPIRVHWHVKSNYRDHWKVKVTVSNYHYGYNFSNWDLVVQHPGLRQKTQANRFNLTRLATVGNMDEAAILWGIQHYNQELLQAGDEDPGSVTTDVLVQKDLDSFTLSNGWALPRKIYFNGDLCEMAMPDAFPGLPSAGSDLPDAHYLLFFPLVFVFLFH